MKIPRTIGLVCAAGMLSLSLSGCGAGAMMALTAAGSAVSIAHNVFDIDTDIHTMLSQDKPAAPIPPGQVLTNPSLLVMTPAPLAQVAPPTLPPPVILAPSMHVYGPLED